MNEGTNSKVGRTVGRKLFRVVASSMVGNAPQIGDARSNPGEGWIKFGRFNLFPEFVRALADNCAPLNACVETMALYLAGNGFAFEDQDGKPIPQAEKKWNELAGTDGPEALLQATALDVALMGTHSWEVIYARGGNVLEVAHMDVCRVRSGKRVDGRIPNYFFSSNWEKYKQPEYEPEAIPAWGEKNNGKVVLYKRGYKQLRDYNGEPHWLAVMTDAEVIARIPVFNRTQIDTGFRPSVMATLTTTKDDADIEELDENFEMVFTGADGKNYILNVCGVGEKLEITKLERGDHAGELDKTRAVSKEEIYHSYGIPPILMGVDVSTGLSGKGLAISETLSMFQNTRVTPMQKPICHSAKMILAACGIEVPVVRIKPLVPFEPAKDAAFARQADLRAMNVGEYRMKTGMPVLTTDDKEPNPDRSNWTEWMLTPLIEVGTNANMNEEQDAEPKENEDA